MRAFTVKDATIRQLKYSLLGGILWGICAAVCYATLLPTLRMFGEMKQSGLVFPIGISMTILLFTVFTVIRFREKLSPAQWSAFAAVTAGILLVKL